MICIILYLFCKRTIEFLILSIGPSLFLKLVISNMCNLALDYSYMKIDVFNVFFKCLFIFIYHMKELIKYHFNLSLIIKSFMRSLLGDAL